MKYTKLLILLISFTSTFFIQHILSFPPEEMWQPTVLLVDFDDVISSKQKIGIGEYLPLIKILFENPSVLTMLMPGNFKKLRQKGMNLKKSINGTSNIVYRMLQDLTNQGYGNLISYIDEIVPRTIKPKPIKQMIDHLYMLKRQGYMLVGATNQDYLQASTYRKKLKTKYNVDLDDLFDLIITTRTNHIKPTDMKEGGYYQMDQKVIMLDNPKAFKPSPDYFETIKTVVKSLHPGTQRFIMTDDRNENLEGAKKAGMDTILFYLPKEHASQSSKKEIKRAIAGWRDGLARKSILI